MKKLNWIKGSFGIISCIVAAPILGQSSAEAGGGYVQGKNCSRQQYFPVYSNCGTSCHFQCKNCNSTLEILRHQLTGSCQLRGYDLVQVITQIPTDMFYSVSEKPLLDLRDLLRRYVGDYNRATWTASDLFQMAVPVNVNVLALALAKTTYIDSVEEAAMIMNRVDEIMRHADLHMHDISFNREKAHMGAPSYRGVYKQVIFDYIESELNRLGVRQMASQIGMPATAPVVQQQQAPVVQQQQAPVVQQQQAPVVQQQQAPVVQQQQAPVVQQQQAPVVQQQQAPVVQQQVGGGFWQTQ